MGAVYGFLMFLAGMLYLTAGMFLCAQVVELGTSEFTHNLSKKLINEDSRVKGQDSIVWLQQGGQIVSD